MNDSHLDALINLSRRPDLNALERVGKDLATQVLEHGRGSKSALAWKMGARLQQADEAGDLVGGPVLVFQYLQSTIEIETGKSYSTMALDEYLALYRLFRNDYERVAQTAFGVLHLIYRFMAYDPQRAQAFLAECVEKKYTEKKVRQMLVPDPASDLET